MVLAWEDVVLAERVADPVLGAEDAHQVRVAVVDDAEQVVALPLVPVGRAVERREAGDVRVVAVFEFDVERDRDPVCVAVDVIDRGERLVLAVADPADALQRVEVHCGVVAEELRYVEERAGGDDHVGVARVLDAAQRHLVAELLL